MIKLDCTLSYIWKFQKNELILILELHPQKTNGWILNHFADVQPVQALDGLVNDSYDRAAPLGCAAYQLTSETVMRTWSGFIPLVDFMVFGELL